MSADNDTDTIISAARSYICARAPALSEARIHLHRLDGPPEGPRYSADAERCCASACPYGVSADKAAAGRCGVFSCPLRRSIRLLLDRQGAVLQEQRGDIHWS
jgi:hypothetical protein